MSEPIDVSTEVPADADNVFVPAHPVRTDVGTEVYIELARMPNIDERIGLAFSRVEHLVALLGDWQPWVSVPLYPFVGLLRSQGVRMLQIDPVASDEVTLLPPESRWSYGDVVATVEQTHE